MTQKSTKLQLEVLLPITSTGVLDILAAMIDTLNHDVHRYIKVHKVNKEYPAVKDKINCSEAIRVACETIERNKKVIWKS